MSHITSLVQWVRQALRLARPSEPSQTVSKKLEAIRAAAKHEFPVGDIEEMLSEIEQGYLHHHQP